jgi:hypothetical protein
MVYLLCDVMMGRQAEMMADAIIQVQLKIQTD